MPLEIDALTYTNGQTIFTGICGICKETFYTQHKKLKYCSKVCGYFAHRNRVQFNCSTCGKSHERQGHKYNLQWKRHFCSVACQRAFFVGANNPMWRGGKPTSNGYRYVTNNGKTTVEHRVVMEKHIGRPLRRFETVHHRNGVRHDNRIENLELYCSSHGAGQRVTDILSFYIRHYRAEIVQLLSQP